jgi:FtsH-binding integral membrane protein
MLPSQGAAAVPAALPSQDARAAFLARTYLHLFGAIATFTAVEVGLFSSGLAFPIAKAMLGTSWLLVLGGFIVVGWLARHTAHAVEAPAAQYAALFGYVVAEAVIFVPLLLIAQVLAPGTIRSAALVTLLGFSLLTAIVFTTRRSFSFLGAMLGWAGAVALLAIVASALFGFGLGTWFSVAMVALAGGAVLFDTSNVLENHPQDRYVGAALELFGSVALMFWYVLRLFLAARED